MIEEWENSLSLSLPSLTIKVQKKKAKHETWKVKTLLNQWKKQNETNKYRHVGRFGNQGLELQFRQ